MSVYLKVLQIIKQSPQYGHFIRNVKNTISLTKAKQELESRLKESPNESHL